MNWDILFPPAIAAVAAGTGWLIRSRWEAASLERERLHETRRGIYLQIIEPYIRLFAGINDPNETQKALKQVGSVDHRRAMFELNLMGSDDVVRAMNALQQHFYQGFHDPNDSESSKNAIIMLSKLLLAIRKDLGNKGTKVDHVDMLRSQITDIDEHL